MKSECKSTLKEKKRLTRLTGQQANQSQATPIHDDSLTSNETFLPVSEAYQLVVKNKINMGLG